MFYYKSFTPLCNCFLFPCSHFKHLKIYHLIFSIGITPLTFYYFTGIPQPFLLAAPCRSGSALRSIVQLSTFSLPPHTKADISPPSISLLLSHHAFPTQSLTECLRSSAHTVSRRFAPGALLRKRRFAALARCHHFPLPFPSTFSQNFLSHAVAQVISNRLLL